jgi:hypothetical protein
LSSRWQELPAMYDDPYDEYPHKLRDWFELNDDLGGEYANEILENFDLSFSHNKTIITYRDLIDQVIEITAPAWIFGGRDLFSTEEILRQLKKRRNIRR